MRVVADDAGTDAHCAPSVKLNTATIRFQSDIEDSDYWRATVVHELYHVKHARIDAFIRECITPQLTAGAEKIADEGYRQHYESHTESMAQILYAMWAVKEKTPKRKAKGPV